VFGAARVAFSVAAGVRAGRLRDGALRLERGRSVARLGVARPVRLAASFGEDVKKLYTAVAANP